MSPLKNELKSNFSLVSQLESDWVEVTGGELAASHHACGTIVSGESLYFHQVSTYFGSILYIGSIVLIAVSRSDHKRIEYDVAVFVVFNGDVTCLLASAFLYIVCCDVQ